MEPPLAIQFRVEWIRLLFVSFIVLSDLLAVVATTVNRRIEIVFEEELFAREMQTILTDKLRFDEIAITPPSTGVDFTENFLLTQRDLGSPTNDFGEQKMFFQRHDGYWNGTLIRMRQIIDPQSNGEYRYHLKIYNKWVWVWALDAFLPKSNDKESNSIYAFRLNEKIDGLINLLSNEFGRKITITSAVRGTNGSMESALRQNFREEREALNELATSLRAKKGDEAEAHRKFINAQHKTDIAYLDIVKSKWIYWRLEMITNCDYFRWNKWLNLYCQRCILASPSNYILEIPSLAVILRSLFSI